MLDKSIPYIGVLMVKTDTTIYPRYNLPKGFTLSGYRVGYEIEWAKLMFEVEQTNTLEEAQKIFAEEFLPMPELLTKQCLFALDKDGEIAATASLWHGSHFGENFQRIHWVATRPKYQSKGLVKALLTKLFDVYNELGYKNFIYLTSQTWSYKALNIYSKFGFKPFMNDEPIAWNNKAQEAWGIIDQKIMEYKQVGRKF
jgi:GNAT superfamily N-acetyltransferase